MHTDTTAPTNPTTPRWDILTGTGRLRAFLRFVLAAAWLFAAIRIAEAVRDWVGDDLAQASYQIVLLVLLLFGFGFMGLAFDRQQQPLMAMGFVRRPGIGREWAVGAFIGWGMVVLAVLPSALAGDLEVSFWTTPRAFWLFALSLVTFAVGTLAEEVAFRGYPFQRLIQAIGPTAATVLMVVFFAAVHLQGSDATLSSTLVTMLAGVIYSVAYLRTRALWLPWGLHFAWKISMGVLFGLPVGGALNFGTIIQSNAVGPHWLTGGVYGPEAAFITVLVLLAGLMVLVRATREYAWHYTFEPIVPAGYPMDAQPPAAHVAMEAQANVAVPLVQILPNTPQSVSANELVRPEDLQRPTE